jgi:hypothetical protein
VRRREGAAALGAELLHDEPSQRPASRAARAERGLDRDAVAASVAEFGGYCDCEVLANVDPQTIF